MRMLSVIVCALLAGIAIIGCTRQDGATSVLTPTNASVSETDWELLLPADDAGLWTQDAAGDTLLIDAVGSGSESALELTHVATGRDQAILRRRVRWDLRAAESLAISAWLPETTTLRLSVVERHHTTFEGPAVTLAPGLYSHAELPLPTDHEDWAEKSKDIRRVQVLLPWEAAEVGSKRTWTFYGLKARSLSSIVIDPPPVIHETMAGALQVPRYGLSEWRYRIAPPPPSKQQLYRHAAISAEATAPDGSLHQVQGFLHHVDASGDWWYAIRFRPWLAGTWQLQPVLDWGDHRQWLPPQRVTCEATTDIPAPVQVDPQDERWFATRDGDFFYPVGQNLAWAGDYQPWLDELAGQGGNWTRIWLCPWNIHLEAGGRLDTIDFDQARELDRVLDLALERGIRVQLCIFSHPMLTWDWQRNPFNRANGGPCPIPQVFWTDRQTRRLTATYLRYLTGRYGGHPALFAWELWNECELAKRFENEDIVDWHRWASGIIAESDAYDHPITTSTALPDHLSELWDIDRLALIPAHRYDRQPERVQHLLAADARWHDRPAFLAEAGRDFRIDNAQLDRDGDYIVHALWSAWIAGAAGAPMPWWWDLTYEPNGLLRHLQHFQMITVGHDPRSRRWQVAIHPLDDHAQLQLRCDDREAWGFIGDPAASIDPARPSQLHIPAGTVHLHGLPPGTWAVQVWNARTGELRREHEADATTAGLPLELDGGSDPLVIHARRNGARLLQVEWQPAEDTSTQGL